MLCASNDRGSTFAAALEDAETEDRPLAEALAESLAEDEDADAAESELPSDAAEEASDDWDPDSCEAVAELLASLPELAEFPAAQPETVMISSADTIANATEAMNMRTRL